VTTYALAIIVCGGRDYAGRDNLFAALDRLLATVPAGRRMLLIEGGYSGADALAAEWARARARCVDHEQHKADWKRYGRNAGPMRNRVQGYRLKSVEAERKGVVACTGGDGTADMVSVARGHGLNVMTVS
jgi:hypothetical protein